MRIYLPLRLDRENRSRRTDGVCGRERQVADIGSRVDHDAAGAEIAADELFVGGAIIRIPPQIRRKLRRVEPDGITVAVNRHQAAEPSTPERSRSEESTW